MIVSDNVLYREVEGGVGQQVSDPPVCAGDVGDVNGDQVASAVEERALGHSEHRVQRRGQPWPSPSSTRDADPGGRPEHYLQGRGCALTALLREVLPPGTGPSKKGR